MEFFGKRNKENALEADFSYNYNPKDGSKSLAKFKDGKKRFYF